MINLISSYYAKGLDSKGIFDTLKIAEDSTYEEHLNKHNVIFLNMSELPRKCKNFETYLTYFEDRITEELRIAFPECEVKMEAAVWDNLNKIYDKTKEGFIFIIDEWDNYFHSKFYTEDGGAEYLSFLRTLLKDQAYVD